MSEKEQKDGTNKVRSKYEKDLADLTRVIGGKFLFTPTKLLPDEVMTAMKELAREEKQMLVETFKRNASAAIQKQREHLKKVAELKKEFEKKEEESMKEFSNTVAGLFRDLKNIEKIEKDYYDILMGITPGKPEDETEELKDEEK